MAEAFIALGGNVGDVRATFDAAIAILCVGPEVRLTARSSDYRTPPWGVTEQPPFINAVIAVSTTLAPHALLDRAQACERALGRDRAREQHWGPRTIDLDILAYDDAVLNDATLTLPHPHLFERAFVLVPLAEIAADQVIAGIRVSDALKRVDTAGIEKLRALGRGTPIARLDRLAGQVGQPSPAWHFAMMTDPRNPTPAADFPPATEAAWRGLVDAVLKGAPFTRLESRTHDGLTIEPLYLRDAAATALGGRAPGAAWTVMQRVDHPDPAAANAQALDDLQNGATGLVLVFAGSVSANGFGLDPSPATLERALAGVDLTAVAIDLNLSPATRHVVRDFATLVKSRGIAPAKVDLRASINPVGGYAASGRGPRGWDELAPSFAVMVGELATAGFRGPFAVADGRIIHNAGGSEAQELAFALASAVAYLRALETHGMALAAARDAIYFRLSADADQFLTMAKFRAARKLWTRIEQACGLTPKPIMIAAETAWRMMTKHDPYVNMLRSTIAVAAAGLGGADAVTVLPHTAPLGLPDPFARRVARNTQLVLLEESNLARVGDPAAGSGALEAMTHALCTAAWAAFREIEQAGVWAALETGLIQRHAAKVRAERERAVARRTDILTGTNEYPNISEVLPAVLDVAPAALPKDGTPITAAALPRIRLAEPFERLRDASDKILAQTGARPKVFLATLGKPADFNARANFAKNFFEAGGIEAVSSEDEPSPLAAAFKASGAALACLCGSDKTYESDVAGAASALAAAGARHIYLAGQPGKTETTYRNAGVQTLIHAGCDALAVLQAAYQILAG